MDKIITYCSDSVKEIYKERGPFAFKKHELTHEVIESRAEKRNITQIADRTYYLGQWRVGTDHKEGRGVLVKDGSIYEGWWKND